MSRKLTVVLLTMLALAGAMGLKTVVSAQGNGSTVVADGRPAPTPW